MLAVVAAAYGGYRWYTAPRPDTRPAALVKRGDIIARTRVTGRVVPREEVFARSLVAGLLDELKVRPGDLVKRGDHIATVRVVADPVALSESRAQVTKAEDRLQRAQRELERVRPIDKKLSVSAKDIALAEDEKHAAEIDLQYARERQRLVAQGAAAGGARSTRVLATIDGTVLAVPVAVGDVIGDTNPYRDGTTLAVIADMNQLLFKGQVEEAYAGKLQIGMPVEVRIGALEGSKAAGKLTWIAPRATIEVSGTPAQPNTVAPLSASSSGITRFELWVELTQAPANVRAGYSAAAEFVLDSRKDVIVVEERALRFDHGQATARVLGPDGGSSERQVSLGLSDGVQIEVLSGLAQGDRVGYADEP